MRGKKDYNQISDYTYEIVEKVKNCNIFKNPQSKNRLGSGPAKIIFCCFGYDEYDVKLFNWRYKSIWVDEDQNKAHWYITNSNSKLINDILVVDMNQYNFIRQMIYTDMTKEEYINKNKEYITLLIKKAREYIRIYREYKNGSVSEDDLITILEPIGIEIEYLFFKIGNLPAFYIELNEWSELSMSLASTISDLALYYKRSNLSKWTQQNREHMVSATIKKYQELIEVLKELEMKLHIK